MKQLIPLLLLAVAVLVLSHEPFQVKFEWKSIDFEWSSDEERQYAVQRGDYIPSNNFISTVKFWKGKMYVTLPRWNDGAPVTLAVTSATPVNDMTAPKLKPYPDWNMQKLGDCSAFQLVHSIEIDPRGRMWVLDTGRPKSLRESRANCPARLVILDLEDNGKILRTYEFPDDVARRDDTYLNDIVLDHEDGVMAYITDSGQRDPGIIVYSLQNNTSWKIRHGSMKAKSEAASFMVAKTHVINKINVDGIALSPASCSKGKCDRYHQMNIVLILIIIIYVTFNFNIYFPLFVLVFFLLNLNFPQLSSFQGYLTVKSCKIISSFIALALRIT